MTVHNLAEQVQAVNFCILLGISMYVTVHNLAEQIHYSVYLCILLCIPQYITLYISVY